MSSIPTDHASGKSDKRTAFTPSHGLRSEHSFARTHREAATDVTLLRCKFNGKETPAILCGWDIEPLTSPFEGVWKRLETKDTSEVHYEVRKPYLFVLILSTQA